MKRLSLAMLLMLAPCLAQAWPWSMDMANQISVKPQESPDPAHPGMYPFPARSVPVPGTTVFVEDLDAAKKMVNPVKADERSVQTGKHLFEIYCTPCHGFKGEGDGLVGKKLIMQPFNLSYTNTMHSWKSPDFPDGYIFGYMTLGGAVMPSYANDLSPKERWNVVNYVRRVLQKEPAGYVAAQSN